MKKTLLFLFVLTVCFSFTMSTAFADSILDKKIDNVLGTPYQWAGTTTDGFDCSGFTRYIFAKFDIDLPHSSRDQSKEGEWVAKKDLRAGDLVFFSTGGGGITHVGIYIGDGYFAHSADNGVTKDKLSEAYYARRYVTARRILNDEQYQSIAVDLSDLPVIQSPVIQAQ